MRRTTKTFPLLAVVAALGVGCSENDHHSDRSGDKDRDGIPNRADPHPNRPDLPAGDVRYDRAGDLRGIPRDAIRLEKDEGPEMRVRPNQDGRIYVYDPRADRIVYEGRLRAKEEFIAIPERDSITIDGKRVDSARLNSRDRYQLYFLRD
jgi:hypothetical protein